MKVYVFVTEGDYTEVSPANGMVMVVLADSHDEAVDICIEKMGYGDLPSGLKAMAIREIKESAFHVLPLEKGSFAHWCHND